MFFFLDFAVGFVNKGLEILGFVYSNYSIIMGIQVC